MCHLHIEPGVLLSQYQSNTNLFCRRIDGTHFARRSDSERGKRVAKRRKTLHSHVMGRELDRESAEVAAQQDRAIRTGLSHERALRVCEDAKVEFLVATRA